MRMHHLPTAAALALAAAGLLIAPSLEAAPVVVEPVTIAASFQKVLHERYGDDEGPVLQKAVTESLSRALKAAGASIGDAAPLHIEVSIEQAIATHPTRKQLLDSPGLDYLQSVARGGAQLRAVLRDAQGKIIDKFDYDRYAASLREASMSASAWGDAQLAFDGFATELVRSWRQHWSS